MIVLDASVWISSIQANDVNFAVSRRWRIDWQDHGNPVFVPAHFLAEVSSAVTRRTDNEVEGIAALRTILDDALVASVPLTNALAESAARCAARCRLRAGDALYVALALELGVPLVTWDQQLLDRATLLVDGQQPAA